MKDRWGEQVRSLFQAFPGKRFTAREILHQSHIPWQDRRQLQRDLDQLVREGQLTRSPDRRYFVPEKKKEIVGRIEVHPDGFGFVRREDTPGEDVFIPPGLLGSAHHGDVVSLCLLEKSGRSGKRAGRSSDADSPRGKVIQVRERNSRRVIGRLFREWRQWMMEPLDGRLLFSVLLPKSEGEVWAEGTIGEAEILVPASRERPAIGRLVGILGTPGDPELAVQIVLHRHSIRQKFPPEAEAEAAELASRAAPGEGRGRFDFRDWTTVTIDGETARDFDDAVSLRRLDNGRFLLGVHIADVSHFVAEGSAMDREAFLRGNSVYLPDRAIPMLPEALSQGLCSLKPGEDRPVFSVLMEIDSGGEVVGHEFVKGTIRSAARLTYTRVAGLLEPSGPEEGKDFPVILPMLRDMAALQKKLQARRRGRGSVELEIPEAEVLLDECGRVTDVARSPKNAAHGIIEEFMILANETVAGRLEAEDPIALFRVHEAPDRAKVQEYFEILGAFGFSVPALGKVLSPSLFQKVADSIPDRPEYDFLRTAMLRSFMQARYSEINRGHFGLASRCYTHFTSPIRRYSDLVVHRLLEESLHRKGRLAERPSGHLPRLADIAMQTSDRERAAADAESDMVDYYRAALMKERLGEVFAGRIVGLRRQGLVIRLERPFLEGQLPAAFLESEGYRFRADRKVFVTSRSGKALRLGEEMQVLLERVDLDSARIVFSPAPAETEKSRGGFLRRRKGGL